MSRQVKSFTGPGVRAILLPKIINAVNEGNNTVGSLERLAGVGPDEASRRAFWMACDQRAQQRTGQKIAEGEAVFAEFRAECCRRIEQQIEWVTL